MLDRVPACPWCGQTLGPVEAHKRADGYHDCPFCGGLLGWTLYIVPPRPAGWEKAYPCARGRYYNCEGGGYRPFRCEDYVPGKGCKHKPE